MIVHIVPVMHVPTVVLCTNDSCLISAYVQFATELDLDLDQ